MTTKGIWFDIVLIYENLSLEELSMKKIMLCIASAIGGAISGIYWMIKKCEPELMSKDNQAKRNAQSFRLACKWIGVIQSGKRIKDYFTERGIETVAIYGMGKLGKCLLQELEQSDIKIAYLIDKNINRKFEKYAFFSPEEYLPEVQTIVVTPSYDFTEISETLKKHTEAEILSIDDILTKLQ